MAGTRIPSPDSALARVQTQLARWQQSLDLHHKYQTLDDAHYWHVQPWPKHERPAAWIVQLARQRLFELKALLEAQSGQNAELLAAALEQMQFLANLVGLHSAERHIPLAEAHHERSEAISGAQLATPERASSAERTREMPRPRAAKAPRVAPANRASVHETVSAPTAVAKTAADTVALQVIQDAVRLLQWGRKWHELGELISRMANRPSITYTRRLLRAHRVRIEQLSARAPAGTG